MSVNNFVPQTWADLTYKEWDNDSVLSQLTNKDYKGEIRELNNEIKIKEDPVEFLVVDKEKFVVIQVYDVDEISKTPHKLKYHTREMGKTFSRITDMDILNTIIESKPSESGTMDSRINLNIENITDFIYSATDKLVLPIKGRKVAVVPKGFFKLIVNAGHDTVIRSDCREGQPYSNGYLGTFADIDFYQFDYQTKGEAVVCATTAVFFIRDYSICSASEINRMEALSLESNVHDGVKCNMLYSAKCTVPSSVAVHRVEITQPSEGFVNKEKVIFNIPTPKED